MWCGFIELGLSGGRWIGRLRECRLACGVRVSGVARSSSMPSITGGLNGAPAGRFQDVFGWVGVRR